MSTASISYPKYLISACILLSLSVALNVLLARQTSRLRSNIIQTQALASLQAGTKVPPVIVTSLDGSSQHVTYDSTNVPTVLYVFTPQCGWCKLNLDNLRVMIKNSGAHYRLIGFSLTEEGLKEYLAKEGLDFPVYIVKKEANPTYRLGLTPETIVISPESVVLNVWRGAYQDHIHKEIQSALHLSLPGCCATPAPSK